MKNADKPIIPIVNQEGYTTHQSFLESVTHQQHLNGLTKREYFAGLAMQGILAREAFYQRMANEGNDVMIKEISKASVKMADELLKQLEE